MNESPITSCESDRILLVDAPEQTWSDSAWRRTCRHARTLGFNGIMAPCGQARHPRTVGAAEGMADPDAHETMDHTLARLAAVCAEEALQFYLDVAPADIALPSDRTKCLAQWLAVGVRGFCCRHVARSTPADWRSLIGEVRGKAGGGRFLAWTPGMSADQVKALRGAGFDATFLSLPWWDFRSGWLAEEHARLSSVAPVIVPVTADGPACLQADAGDPGMAWRRCVWTAAVSGSGVLVSDRVLRAGAVDELRAMNEWLGSRRDDGEALTMLTGSLSACTALIRGGAGVVLNPSSEQTAPVDWPLLRARLPDGYSDIQLPCAETHASLAPAACMRFTARRALPVRPASSSMAEKRKLGLGAMSGSRIAIESIEPLVDGGRFAVKATPGQTLGIEADIFMDGHDRLAACVAWRAADESGWQEVRMEPLGNDRWRAVFTPVRLGRHVFAIRAWLDSWESYRIATLKKRDAGADITLDLLEGLALLRDAAHRARRQSSDGARTLQDVLDSGETDADALLSDATAHAMAQMDARPFETMSDEVHVMVERRKAGFSSWYELFPRSQAAEPGRHGSFQDVRGRLAAIRDMGFDVLYFPPIHPIGRTNRKGRNNALAAAAGDPGSPYAIGSEEGGHDALHPQLGSLDDFKELLDDARGHGLEVALDFAIQCSPDHPWLAEHRNWFNWRPDGSLRYAENPPKRYEDIVNPDFYQGSQPKPRASLWRALRDIVLYWAGQGVRIFRVDNPHTKPLPFWEWMLGEVHARHPDVIFLSEAFTRPRMMHRLAKLGFSQSYTYFTWRNDKRELTTYMEELASSPLAESFRPNFFVNTPDINPYFLQASGRAGFLIRAALAATLSGSWGVYSGFELCEARALPGREEYMDSEKYELRSWDWDRPGNIIAEISRLNRIRQANPALWTHLGVRFHTVHDDEVLFFSKTTQEGDNIVLVAISLDPHSSRKAWLELPLWSWGLADNAHLQLDDLCSEAQFELHGKHHEIELTPERPYLVWRIRRLG